MKIPTGNNGIPIISGTMPQQQARPAASAPSQGEAVGRHFDQVTIQTKEACSPFEAELKSRLTQEVCTATTTGTVSVLRKQIRNGEFRPDPAEIARKMLLLTEEK